MNLIMDLNEGKFANLCCRLCLNAESKLEPAAERTRECRVSLVCRECGAPLITFDQFTMEVANA